MAGKDYSGTLLSQSLGAKPGAGVVVQSCSIDERWQALRFVYRLEDRPG